MEYSNRSSPKFTKKSPKKSNKRSNKRSKKKSKLFGRKRGKTDLLRNRIDALKLNQIELNRLREQHDYFYKSYAGSIEYYRQESDNNSRALYDIIFKMYSYFNKLLNQCSKKASKINTQVEDVMHYTKINENWNKFTNIYFILRDMIKKCINDDKTIMKYIKKNKLEKTNDKNLKILINKKFNEFKLDGDKIIRDGDNNMYHYKYNSTKSTPMSFYSFTRS